MGYLLDALDRGGWRRPHVLIAMGKGGVGKTTTSLRLAWELRERMGWRVLLASMDPAGHLLEYLRLPAPLREVEVSPGLRAVQYRVEPLAEKVAREYGLLLKRLMPALTALGSLDVEKAVRQAPGFEEEVFLRILWELYQRGDVDAVVIDTPPTGVSLRVLRLPSLYLFWIRTLRELRERIVATKYAIARALGRLEELEKRDPVLEKLAALAERYRRLLGELRDPARTGLVIVATPEPLPVYEARVVAGEAGELGLRVELVVANRVLGPKAAGLGLAETEEKALGELEALPAGMALVRHAERPPSSLRDVEALTPLIEPRPPGSCGA